MAILWLFFKILSYKNFKRLFGYFLAIFGPFLVIFHQFYPTKARFIWIFFIKKLIKFLLNPKHKNYLKIIFHFFNYKIQIVSVSYSTSTRPYLWVFNFIVFSQSHIKKSSQKLLQTELCLSSNPFNYIKVSFNVIRISSWWQ